MKNYDECTDYTISAFSFDHERQAYSVKEWSRDYDCEERVQTILRVLRRQRTHRIYLARGCDEAEIQRNQYRLKIMVHRGHKFVHRVFLGPLNIRSVKALKGVA